MSQVEQNEQPPEERIEDHKREALSNESLARLKHIVVGVDLAGDSTEVTYVRELPEASDKPTIYRQLIDDETEYINATEEEKVLHCATKMVLDVLNKVNNSISIQDQETLLARTIRQVRAERQNAFQVLNEAEEELKRLTWNSILPQSLTEVKVTTIGRHRSLSQTSARGMRGIYIVTFGNFAMAKNDNWIYRPTQQQMLNGVCRFIKRKRCERVATDLRIKLQDLVIKPRSVGISELATMTSVECDEMVKFKKHLLDQINELRATV